MMKIKKITLAPSASPRPPTRAGRKRTPTQNKIAKKKIILQKKTWAGFEPPVIKKKV